jgi:Tfp pilus assembly protein PilF
MSSGWKPRKSPVIWSSSKQVQEAATSSVERTSPDESAHELPALSATTEPDPTGTTSRRPSREVPSRPALRNRLLVLGVVVVLAVCGIGLWLGTRGSGSSPSAENARAATGLFDDGLHAQVEGNLAKAANDYLRSLNLNPNDKLAWYDLGLIEQQDGLNASAEHDYEASIADDSRLVPALYNLGTLVASSDPARATKLYERVIAIQPKDAGAHLNLGFALRAQGKLRQGNAQIAEAVRLDPSLSSRTPDSATAPETQAP